MPHVATSIADLVATLAGIAHIEGDRLVIDDERRFRAESAADLAWTAAFTEDDATAEAVRWIVWEASQALGARSASIEDLYRARGRGEISGFTVPAINIRAQTFDMARTFYTTATRADVGTVIFELARSEQTYTWQRPMDYATSILAGAIAAGWSHPVFIQGDHYQFNAKKYAADPEAMTEEIRRACRLAIDAGYRNIDIDSSTLVDLSRPNLDEEQRENYTRAAELTALIRSLQIDGVTVSVGGEIGEVGKQNSTPMSSSDLDGYTASSRRARRGQRGCPRSASRRGPRTAAYPSPAGAWPRSSSTSRCSPAGRDRAHVRAGRGGPARGIHAARRAVPPLPGGRDGRDPSRDRVPERALRPPGVPGRARRPSSRPGAARTRPTSARPARRTSSSCTPRARRRSGRSSASCGSSRRASRSWPTRAQGRVPVLGAGRQRVDGDAGALHPPGSRGPSHPGGPARRRRLDG